MTGLAAVAGLLAGLAVLVLIEQLRPAPPRLDVVLGRIQTTRLDTRPGLPGQDGPGGVTAALGRWAAERLGRPAGVLTIPRTHLAVLGKPAETFMAEKIGLFLAGMILPSLLWGLLAWAGTAVPWTLPTIASLTLAVVLSYVPDLSVRSDAAKRRREFRHAFTCYLQLVVLEREAGAALAAALEAPATIADGWAFGRIDDALQRARRAGRQPWQALADLGEQIAVHDLHDLAYTAMIAGGEGAKMHDVLTAKIASMRHEASAAARAEANTRTTTMWVPVSLLMLGFVVLIGFPFFYRLIGST
jgi:hypothetical protein